MKTALLALGILLVIANTSYAQTYLSPDWLVQPDLPLSTGPVYVADAVKTVDDATYVIGDFRNGADFDISPADTSYVKTTYNHSQFLAKYDKAGKLLFEISLGSSFSLEYGYNFFTGVTSDAEGNAYITGCFGYGFDFDPGPAVVSFPAGYYDRYMFVAKYDKEGHLVFANPITTKNDKTFPEAIAVDKQSNVYIAGIIAGSNNDFDPGAATASLNGDKLGDGFFAKYDKSGNFLFVKLLTGSAGEVVNAITTDKNNNLLATGYYDTNSNDFDPGPDTAKLAYKGGGDFFFAKYSPNGDYLFAKSVGGKGGESANAIITDNRNNIIITGGFTGVDADFDPGKGKVLRSAAGGSTYADIYIEKFDSLGNYKWVNTAGGTDDDGGVSLVSDKAGNFFISGFIKGADVVFHNTIGRDTLKSAGGYDIVYAKYDSLGTCRYVQRIGDKKDNSGGNILLTGDSLITFTGNFIDSLDFNPSPERSELYALNNTAFFATYKSSNGAYVSAKEIGVFGYFRDQSDVFNTTQDKAGNTYVIGSYTGITDFDPGPDTVLLTSRSEIAHDNGSYDEDQFFAKYDKNGKLVYVKTFTTTGHDAAISGITIDDNENVYICGSYYGQINFVPGTDTAVFGKVNGVTLNMYFAKYNASGKYLFSVNLKSELSSFSNIALDKQKNIYLTGLLDGSARFNPADSSVVTRSYSGADMLIAKYDSLGRFIYVTHIGQNGNVQGYSDYVYANDMSISDSGRIVICGELRGSKTDFDPGAGKYYLSSGKSTNAYFVAAYTLNGNLLFATGADTSSVGQTSANKLALDGENAIISGISYDAADLYPGPDSAVITNRYTRDPFFIKYNRSGAIQFINTNMVSEKANNALDIDDIAVDTSHHIYIVGSSFGKVDFDFGTDTVFLDSSGNANYLARYDGNGNYDYVQEFSTTYLNNLTRALFVNQQNEIVAAGYGYGTADIDPGPDTLLFHSPVYGHRAFYITKYKQINDDKKLKLLIARGGSRFRVFENLR